MCLGVVGEILQIDNTTAVVDIMGMKKSIMIDLIPDIKVGEYVLIHAGMAIEKLKKTAAQEIIDMYKEINIVGE